MLAMRKSLNDFSAVRNQQTTYTNQHRGWNAVQQWKLKMLFRLWFLLLLCICHDNFPASPLKRVIFFILWSMFRAVSHKTSHGERGCKFYTKAAECCIMTLPSSSPTLEHLLFLSQHQQWSKTNKNSNSDSVLKLFTMRVICWDVSTNYQVVNNFSFQFLWCERRGSLGYVSELHCVWCVCVGDFLGSSLECEMNLWMWEYFLCHHYFLIRTFFQLLSSELVSSSESWKSCIKSLLKRQREVLLKAYNIYFHIFFSTFRPFFSVKIINS